MILLSLAALAAALPAQLNCFGDGDNGIKFPTAIHFTIERATLPSGEVGLRWTESTGTEQHSFPLPVQEVVPYGADGFKVIGAVQGTKNPNPIVYQLYVPPFCGTNDCISAIMQITDTIEFKRSYLASCHYEGITINL
ncbi:MAG: hypothetical protein JST16_02535 [Bdellovibrionales bacterium]|nr:hypothetical protein [Bdellovibrionales bacterium]